MLKKYGILIFLISFSYQLQAQKNIETQNLVWTRYLLKFNFNEKWTPFVDVEERFYVFPFRQHHFVISSGTNYKLDKSFSLSASMMYFEMLVPQDPESKERDIFQELRPQVALNFKHSIDEHWSFLSRFKAELRYMNRPNDTEYTFNNYRFRMRMGIKYRFNDKWDAKVLEEVHIAVGKKIVRNVFDQNRLSTGLNHNINPNFSFETGYMFWFQQRASGVDFFSRNIAYFTLKHNLNF